MESYFDGYLPVAAGVRAAVRYEKETFFMSDTPNEKKFMREKVVKPPIDKRRAAGRILCYVLFAAVFGGVAAVSFVASLPTAKKLLGKERRADTGGDHGGDHRRGDPRGRSEG